MQEDIKNSSEDSSQVPQKRKKNIPAKILKVFSFIIILFILLIVGLLIFIQTDIFNRWVLEFTLDKLNEGWKEKDSQIYAENIEGNIFSGITLLNGNITVKGDTLIQYNSLEVKYDLWTLLDREITVKNLTFSEPTINLTKIRDSRDSLEWNIVYLFTTEEEADTTESVFDWRVVANNVSIENATVRIVENKEKGIPFYNIEMDRLDEFGLANLFITNFNLKLDADYYYDKKIFRITDLNFKTNSDFNLHNLSFDTEMLLGDDTTTVIKNMQLITDRTNLKIDEMSMEKMNILGEINYDEWKDRDVKVTLLADKFDFKDLSFFLPSLNFLDSTIYLDLNASGKYGDLNVNKLDLRLPNSNFNLSGNLKNLQDPENLLYDITGNDINIDPSDTKRVLPGLDIPDYSNVGYVNIPYLTYKGESTKFNTEFDIRTALAGSAHGNVYFDFNQPLSYYRGEAYTVNLDLGRIINDYELKSSITADLVFDARGFDPAEMSGRINYEMRNSAFSNIKISRSAGQLNFNSGNLQMDLTIASNAMSGQVAGSLKNLMNPENLIYDLRGTARGLNLGVISGDNSLNSDLNLTFDVNGSGTGLDNISGNFKIDLDRSSFKEYIIPPTPVIAEFNQSGENKEINISSDFLNLEAKGSFTFSALFDIIDANIQKITGEFMTGLEADTLLSAESLNLFKNRASRNEYSSVFPDSLSGDDLNFNYTIQVKNITSLSAMTGLDSTTEMNGTIAGSIRQRNNIFSMTLDGDIKNFRYNDSLLFVKNALINVNMLNDVNKERLYGLDASMNVYADSLVINNMSFDSTRVNFDFFDNRNRFLISSNMDSTVKMYTTGSVGYESKQAGVLVMDSLALKYGEFLVNNQDELVVKYYDTEEKNGIELEKFTLKEDFQRVSIDGFYSFNDSSNIKLSADNIDLSEYQRLLVGYVDEGSELTGNIRRLEAVLEGTLEDPRIHLEANSDILRMGGTVIGRLDALIDYEDEEIKPEISFFNMGNAGSFSLTGSIPYQNPLYSEDTISFVSQPVDLKVEANNFQMKLIQQLIPQTRDLEGILTGEIDVKGTVRNPVLTGSMNIKNGAFTVDMTGMRYNFEADLNTEAEKIVIPYSKIYVPDEEDIFLNITGFIDFTDLTINEMDLAVTGDVKALDKQYGMTELGVEGDLYIGSGTPQLKLTGSKGNYNLTGNVILVRGNVTINPFIREAYNIYADNFIYGVIIDSTYGKNDSVRTILFENPDSLSITKNKSLNPFEKILNTDDIVSKQARTPEGIFFYDVHVTTTDKLFLTFIVNEKTRQEFFGQINADLYINNKNATQKMTPRGIVTLGDNSYYRFFKKFQADGQVIFNGELTNPQLVIDAEYNTQVPSNSPGAQTLSSVTIELKVRGEAKNPTLSIGVSQDGVPITGSDATSDALSLLVFGQFKSNLGYNERSSLVGGLGANIGTVFLSDYISSAVENIFPFILNTDVNYVETKEGTFIQNTDIRFTAEVGDAIIRFGGRFLQSLNNTDVVIEYPLNRLFGYEGISRNFVLQLERVVDPFATTSTYVNETRTGALLYYRIKF